MAILSTSESKIVKLTNEQKIMLEMSEQDIKKRRLISQEAMDKRNMEWLNELNNQEINNPLNHKF